MKTASDRRGGKGVAVKFVMEKTESGARWVVKDEASGVDSREGKPPLPAQHTREKWGTPEGETGPEIQNSLSEQSQNPHFSQNQGEMGHPRRILIPLLCACADPAEKWWERVRGNPKRAGEISQAAFLLKAEMLGFDLALPWGDNQKFDFVVWRRDGRAMRVQVNGTGRLHRRGYEVQPVHATRRGGKKRYTKKDIDVIAAHVQPADAWYLIPIEKVGRAKSLRLYPGIEMKVPTTKVA